MTSCSFLAHFYKLIYGIQITEEIFEKLNIDAQTLFHDKMTAAR